MRKGFSYLLKDRLIVDTAVIFVGTSIGGVFNLIYQLVSVRLLSPSDYGTFNALVSLVIFASMAASPLGTTLVRFFTEYITKRDFSTLKSVSEKLIKRISGASFLIILYFVFSSTCWLL